MKIFLKSNHCFHINSYKLQLAKLKFLGKRSRCQLCAYVNEMDSFTSTVTGETYQINHRFNFMEKLLIYPLTCNKCRK